MRHFNARTTVALSLAAATTALVTTGQAQTKTKLVYWQHVNAPTQALEKKLLATYQAQNPNIEIEYLALDFNDVPTKVTTALAGGTGPDIFNYFQSAAASLVEKGLLAPLDFKAYGVDGKAAFTGRYSAAVANGFTTDGTVYGVPQEVSSFAFWINTAMFKAAGLDPDKDFPKTWADVARVGKKLTLRKGGKTVQQGMVQSLYSPIREALILDSMARQAGGPLFSEDGKKALLNSAPAVEALRIWGDLVHLYKINDPALGPTASTDAIASYGGGTAAMINIGGSWMTSLLETSYPKVYKTYKVGQQPIFSGGPQIGGDLYGFGLYVPVTSKNQAEAWKFARFLADNSEAYFKETGIWMGDKAVLSSPVTASVKDWNVFKASFERGYFLPPVVNYNELSEVIERAVQRVVLNKMSAKASLDQAQKEAEPLMK